MKAREINDTIRYTMWSVFRRAPLGDAPGDVDRCRAFEPSDRR